MKILLYVSYRTSKSSGYGYEITGMKFLQNFQKFKVLL